MAEFFNGTSAPHQQVKVLVLNKYINVYEANSLLYSAPLDACSLQKTGNKVYVYLNTDSRIYLVLEEDTPAAKLVTEELSLSKTGSFTHSLRTKLLIFISIILLLGAGVFLAFNWAIPAIGLKIISTKQEETFGNTIYAGIAEQQKTDSTRTLLLQQFADHLNLSNTYKIRTIIIKDEQVNAFALPGGIIVVNSGIIQNMQSYEELTALLGHEVTHINNRHSLRSMLKSLSVSASLSLLLGDVSSGIIKGATQLNQLSYSRKLETEADKAGVSVLYQNHINPDGMVRLMQTLEAMEKVKPIGFLSSHPLTQERIKIAQGAIQQLPAENYPIREDLNTLWKQLKSANASW